MFIVLLFNLLFFFRIDVDIIQVNNTIGVKFYSCFNLSTKIIELFQLSYCKHACYKFYFIHYIYFNLLQKLEDVL